LELEEWKEKYQKAVTEYQTIEANLAVVCNKLASATKEGDAIENLKSSSYETVPELDILLGEKEPSTDGLHKSGEQYKHTSNTNDSVDDDDDLPRFRDGTDEDLLVATHWKKTTTEKTRTTVPRVDIRFIR
jgi:hypothetical protein